MHCRYLNRVVPLTSSLKLFVTMKVNDASGYTGACKRGEDFHRGGDCGGESVAGHGIVPSRDFEKVMEQLRLAAEALDKVELPDGVVLRFPQAVRV
jgi:hypothetical protein